jgi:hypothetical protein
MKESEILQKNLVEDLFLLTIENIEYLDDLLNESYFTDDLKDIIKILIKCIEKVYLKIIELNNNIKNHIIIKDNMDKIKLYSNIFKEIYKLYSYIEIGRRKNVSPSATYLIEHLTQKIPNKTNFILIPIHSKSPKYNEINEEIKKLFDPPAIRLKDILPENSKKTPLIMFPYNFKNSLIMNILLAHEISHYLAIEENISNELYKGISYNRNKIRDIANKEMSKDTDKAFIELISVIQSWFEEIFCDVVAFQMIGPAFLVAFSHYFLSKVQDPIENLKVHPPIELRLKILYEEYSNSEYPALFDQSSISYLNSYKSHIEDYHEYVKDLKIDKNTIGELYYYAYSIILRNKKRIHKKSEEITKRIDIKCNEKNIINQSSILIKSLENLTTPCEVEIGKSADPVSIINAAIIYKFEILDDIYNEIITNHKNIKLKKDDFELNINRLVLKGIEQCLIQSKMEKFKSLQ